MRQRSVEVHVTWPGLLLLTAFIFLIVFLTGCPPSDSPPNPTATPTPASSAQPTATPSATATPFPSPGSSTPPIPDDQLTCVDPDVYPTQYGKYIVSVQRLYLEQHASLFKDGTTCFKDISFWNPYYFEIVGGLNRSYPVEAIVDDCGGGGICGEIAVKGLGVKKGTGFSEQHHILASSGCLRIGGGAYRGRCTPAWFDK